LAKDKLRRPSINKKNRVNDEVDEDEADSMRSSELSHIKIEIKKNKILESYINLYQSGLQHNHLSHADDG